MPRLNYLYFSLNLNSFNIYLSIDLTTKYFIRIIQNIYYFNSLFNLCLLVISKDVYEKYCIINKMAIFDNKKVYLRRKSSRLMSTLMKISFPALIILGVYVVYNRSPHNKSMKTTIQ
jgi:hypothetical protein